MKHLSFLCGLGSFIWCLVALWRLRRGETDLAVAALIGAMLLFRAERYWLDTGKAKR